MIIIYNLAIQFSTMKFLQACSTKIFITILAKPKVRTELSLEQIFLSVVFIWLCVFKSPRLDCIRYSFAILIENSFEKILHFFLIFTNNISKYEAIAKRWLYQPHQNGLYPLSALYRATLLQYWSWRSTPPIHLL